VDAAAKPRCGESWWSSIPAPKLHAERAGWHVCSRRPGHTGAHECSCGRSVLPVGAA